MEKYILYFTIFCFLSCQGSENDFFYASKLYDTKEYQKAINLYKKVNNKGPSVYYNMGNCFFKLKKYPEALMYWRKAEKNNNSLSLLRMIDYNIRFLKEMLGKKQDKSTVILVRNFFNLISFFILQILLIALLLFLILLNFYKKRIFYIVILIVLIVLIFFAKLFFLKENRAVVKKSGSVFILPNKNSGAIGELKSADEIFILDKKDDIWSKVKKSNIFGWIESEKLLFI